MEVNVREQTTFQKIKLDDTELFRSGYKLMILRPNSQHLGSVLHFYKDLCCNSNAVML